MEIFVGFVFQIIDWTLASISIRESDLHSLADVLTVSPEKIDELQIQGRWLFQKYFRDVKQIVLTLLDELNDRVFPHLSKNYLNWNIPTNTVSVRRRSKSHTVVCLVLDTQSFSLF